MKKFNLVFIFLFFVVLGSVKIEAHGVWIANRISKLHIILGEGPEDLAYNSSMITKINGFDSKYNPVEVNLIDWKDYNEVKTTAKVVAFSFNYGYWSTDGDKWYNLPMSKLKNATKGTHAVKYSVNYLGDVSKVKPIADIPLQLVPSTNLTKLRVGDKYTVHVLKDGKVLPNTDVIIDVINHNTVTKKTDKEGKVELSVLNGGLNVVGVELAFPYSERDKEATQEKIFSSLSFTILPE